MTDAVLLIVFVLFGLVLPDVLRSLRCPRYKLHLGCICRDGHVWSTVEHDGLECPTCTAEAVRCFNL